MKNKKSVYWVQKVYEAIKKLPCINVKEAQQLIKMVESLVSKFSNNGDPEDLRSVGVLKIIEMLPTYDRTKGASPATYCYQQVKKAMRQELKLRINLTLIDQSLVNIWLERIPPDILDKLTNIKNQRFSESKIFLSTLKAMIGDARTIKFKSLILRHTKHYYEKSIYVELSDAYYKTDKSLEEGLIEQEQRRILNKGVEELAERKREVTKLYFYEGLTLEEIAKSYGISKERVRQIKNEAISDLRVYFQKIYSKNLNN